MLRYASDRALPFGSNHVCAWIEHARLRRFDWRVLELIDARGETTGDSADWRCERSEALKYYLDGARVEAMLAVFYALIAFAVVVMVAALVLVMRLRRVARGGRIGRVVNLLAAFILFFLIGYAVAPFTPGLPPEVGNLLTAVVFLFGAIFVVIVLRLIEALVRQVFEELEL